MSTDRVTPIPPDTTHFHEGNGHDDVVHLDDDIRTHQLVTRADFDAFRLEMDDWRASVLVDSAETKGDIKLIREAMQGIAKHVLVPATIPPPVSVSKPFSPYAMQVLPPPAGPAVRDKLPSIVDEAQLERLTDAPNGQARYAMTSGYMKAVIDTSVASKIGVAVGEALKQKERDDKVALVDDVKGRAKGAGWALGIAGALTLAGILWAKLMKYWN